MTRSLEKILTAFLDAYCSDRPTLLLGLSGGPDSMALFHLLCRLKYPFEVAHVDHNWRTTSSQEARYLQHVCAEHHVVFHVRCLEFPAEQTNLEEKGREARLAFFQEVMALRGLRGLLLAHQADDHAETVLKRIFEGASLTKLQGLSPLRVIHGITIYRPLLEVPKREILKWLKQENIGYFLDPTNEDERFLRSRLRLKLIPYLSKHFGKEVAFPLCRVGKSASELEAFINDLIAPFLQLASEREGEWILNLSEKPPEHPYLWKMIVRNFFHSKQIAIPDSQVEGISNHLQKNNCHKSMKIGGHLVIVHRRTLHLKKRI